MPVSEKEKEKEKETDEWYVAYYKKKGGDRNDPLSNRGVMFQVLANDVALWRSFSFVGQPLAGANILDVGGSSGGSITLAFALGARSSDCTVMDIQSDRIREGMARFPSVNFVCGDAQEMPFKNGAFDFVMASTMFVQITDDSVAKNIAAEMIRVLKPGGHILVRDWSFPKPGDGDYKPLDLSRLQRLFSSETVRLVRTERGALVPPVGRLLSRFAPWAYFGVRAILPFLAGAKVYVLHKKMET